MPKLTRSILRGVVRGVLGHDDDGDYNPPVVNTVLWFPLTTDLNGVVDGVDAVADFSVAPGDREVEDFENVVHQCKDSEARFWKARRVENLLIGDSEDITDWAGSGVVTSSTSFSFGVANADISSPVVDRWPQGEIADGQQVIISFDVETDTATDVRALLRDTTQFTGGIDVPLVPGERVHYTSSIVTKSGENGDTFISVQVRNHGVAGDIVYISNIQMERVTGSQSIDSEYIHSLTDHGANVDGVKYFNTDRSGNALSDMRGLLVESAYGERCSVSRPAILNQANANDFAVYVDSFTVADGSPADPEATFLIAAGAADDLKISAILDDVYVGSASDNVTIADDNLSKLRHLVLMQESVLPGVTFQLNVTTETEPDTTDLNLADGDGLIHIGTDQSGGQYANAGFGLLEVKQRT